MSESDSESTESVSKTQEVGKGGGQQTQNNRPQDELEERSRGGRGR